VQGRPTMQQVNDYLWSHNVAKTDAPCRRRARRRSESVCRASKPHRGSTFGTGAVGETVSVGNPHRTRRRSARSARALVAQMNDAAGRVGIEIGEAIGGSHDSKRRDGPVGMTRIALPPTIPRPAKWDCAPAASQLGGTTHVRMVDVVRKPTRCQRRLKIVWHHETMKDKTQTVREYDDHGVQPTVGIRTGYAAELVFDCSIGAPGVVSAVAVANTDIATSQVAYQMGSPRWW
jgi:hypothetical protein